MGGGWRGIDSAVEPLARTIEKQCVAIIIAWLHLPISIPLPCSTPHRPIFTPIPTPLHPFTPAQFEWHTIKRQAQDIAMLEEEMAKNKAKERDAYAKAHAV